MFRLSSHDIADIVAAESIEGDVSCCGVSIDSREIMPDNLFIAVVGETHDGHDYIEQAVSAGAAAVMVNQRVPNLAVPQLVVSDTNQALLMLARYWRNQQSVITVGVTGSCGKTSVRQMLQCIFARQGKTHASCRSYNNHFGVSLTALQLDATHQYYIQEVGANHIGEIASLVSVVQPDIAIITNAAEAHLEGFGSLAGVVQAKGEILSGLTNDGVAVLNADDAHYDVWKSQRKDQACCAFSMKTSADVMAESIQYDAQGRASFDLMYQQHRVPIQLQLLGKHHVANALAAAAAACSAGISLENIQQGLEATSGETHRLQMKLGIGEAMVVDDSYNANPLSVLAAIDWLSRLPNERILVLGDMLELGDASLQWHTDVGEAAKNAGISRLYGLGDAAKSAVAAFGDHAQHFMDQKKLLAALVPSLSSKSTVLVKGSHAMGMKAIVDQLALADHHNSEVG